LIRAFSYATLMPPRWYSTSMKILLPVILVLLVILSTGCITSSAEWNQRGETHHTMGRYEEAVAAFDQAVAADQANSEAWKNRGLTLALLGRDRESEESFARAISLNPGDTDVFYYQALSRNVTGNRTGALASLDHAAAIPPRDRDQAITLFQVLVLKGDLLTMENRSEDAIAAYQKAHEVMMSMI